MPRTFAYVRVSIADQVGEIKAAGFAIEPRRIVTEIVSGSAALAQRPGFIRLLDCKIANNTGHEKGASLEAI